MYTRLLISPKWCVASCGPEKWLWDAREPGESAFAVAFVCFQESNSQPDVQSRALGYCTVPQRVSECFGVVIYGKTFLVCLQDRCELEWVGTSTQPSWFLPGVGGQKSGGSAA